MLPPKVYVVHENREWLPPFAEAFAEEGVPWEEWFLDGGVLDLAAVPPPGVFYSRMSASSHTRGHVRAKDHTRAVLSWLEAHGRRVVNGRRVLELEMSKVDQLTALAAAGIDVPRTIAVVGADPATARAQARRLPLPFVTKDDQGGKGLGVRRFDAYEDFDAYLDSPAFTPPVNHVLLLQEYVAPAEPFITRVELVGGQFLYAVAADVRGGFELCPADACGVDGTPPFRLREDFDHPVVGAYVQFAKRWDVEIAAFEFIETADGRVVTYDVNTNTNYNPQVEAVAPRSGPREVARFLGRLLAAQPAPAPSRAE